MAALRRTSSGGWGRAKWWPVTAIVVGLSGGFALGRSIRHVAPTPDTAMEDRSATVTGRPEVVHRAPDQPLAKAPEAVSPTAPPASPTAPPPPPIAPVAPVAPTPPPSEVSPTAARPVVPVAAPVSPTAPPPSAGAAKSTAHIKSTPEGAQVARATDGEPLGITPFDLALPESDQPVKLLFWKKGFQSQEKQLVPRGEVTLSVALAAEAQKKKHAASHGKSISNTTTIDPFN